MLFALNIQHRKVSIIWPKNKVSGAELNQSKKVRPDSWWLLVWSTAAAGLLKTGRTCQVQDPFIEDNEPGAMKKNTGVSLSEYKLYRSQHFVM